jgi:hypothetical protein
MLMTVFLICVFGSPNRCLYLSTVDLVPQGVGVRVPPFAPPLAFAKSRGHRIGRLGMHRGDVGHMTLPSGSLVAPFPWEVLP